MAPNVVPLVRNEPCDCPPGECKKGAQGECVNKMTGYVAMYRCPTCDAGTWHQDHKCLRCGTLHELGAA